MIKTTRRLLVPLIACAIAACGSDQTGPGPDTLVGTYNAVSVNGSPLPFTTASGSILKTYTITTRSDQTYDLAFTQTLQNGSPSNVSDTGTYVYTASSGQLNFTGQAIPGTLHAAVTDAGGTITLSSADVGYSIVLKR